MSAVRKHPLFAAVLVVCAVAVAAEAWLLYQTWQRTERARTVLRQRQEERDWLARQKPAPTQENTEAIAADVAGAEKRLNELRKTIGDRKRGLSAAPKRPTDAYFALASFVEKARALAVRQQVEVRADERFGFSTYANVGPDTDLLAAVHRQRWVIESLVESLLESRPRSILSVQRELPRRKNAASASAANDGESSATGGRVAEERVTGDARDFFEMDPQLRLSTPGLVESEAFRLEFTGQTQSLRGFLNSLAAFKLPLVVRSVQVSPLPPESSLAERAAAEAAVPLVAQNFSKFAVVIEYVELASAPLTSTP